MSDMGVDSVGSHARPRPIFSYARMRDTRVHLSACAHTVDHVKITRPVHINDAKRAAGKCPVGWPESVTPKYLNFLALARFCVKLDTLFMAGICHFLDQKRTKTEYEKQKPKKTKDLAVWSGSCTCIRRSRQERPNAAIGRDRRTGKHLPHLRRGASGFGQREDVSASRKSLRNRMHATSPQRSQVLSSQSATAKLAA